MRGRLILGFVACGLSPGFASAEEPDSKSFDQLIYAGRAALKKKDHATASALCAAAEKKTEEPPSGGPRSTKATRLCAEAALVAGDFVEAAKLFKAAQRHSLDDLAEHRRLLQARRGALQKATHPNEAKAIDQLLEADQKVQAALRRPGRAPATLGATIAELTQAAKLHDRDKNDGYAAIAEAAALLVRARSGELKDPAKAAELAEAAEASVGKGPKPARAAALEAAFLAAESQALVEKAAEWAIRLNHTKGAPGRCGGRSRELDRACKKLDLEQGLGRCARLELDLVDRVSLYDFSKDKKRAELSEDDIEKVHANALAALQACVLRRAKNEPERYRDTDLTLGWVIDPEGKPKDVTIAPKRYRDDLEDCAALIGCFRYPRVTSKEPKSVSVPYHLD